MMYASLIQRLTSYLIGLLSIDQLEEAIVTSLQDFLDSNDQEAIRVVNEIDGLVVEHGEGLLSEDEFRQYVYRIVAQQGQPLVLDYAQTTNQVISETQELSQIRTIQIHDSFHQIV